MRCQPALFSAASCCDELSSLRSSTTSLLSVSWLSAASLAIACGDVSSWAIRSSARVRGRSSVIVGIHPGLPVELIYELVHESAHVANGPDCVRVRHPRWPKDPHDADRAVCLAICGQDQRYVTHLIRTVFGANQDLDLATVGEPAKQRTEVVPVLEHGKDAPELLALAELGRLHHVEEPVAEDVFD